MTFNDTVIMQTTPVIATRKVSIIAITSLEKTSFSTEQCTKGKRCLEEKFEI